MHTILRFLDRVGHYIWGRPIDRERDHAIYHRASILEHETFSRVFKFIYIGLLLVMFCGLGFVFNLTQHHAFLVVFGILWVIPFILVGVLLFRFRKSLFVRMRDIVTLIMYS